MEFVKISVLKIKQHGTQLVQAVKHFVNLDNILVKLLKIVKIVNKIV